MSEALKLKRHLFITSVENAEGTQTWWVDAASKEDALAKFEAGNCEIYSSEVEVTKLGEPEYLGATSLDDFGDAENKTEIESLRADLLHVTPAERWIEGELDRIDPHRHEQGHDGAEAEALRKLVFEFHQACDLLISYCNKHPTMGDSMFSVLLMRQLLGRGRDATKGQS